MKYGTLLRIPVSDDLFGVCEEKFAQLEAAGMDACQLVYKPEQYLEQDADIIKAAAERHNIEISAQFCGFIDGMHLWDTHYDFYLAGINSPIAGETRIKYLFSAIPFLKKLGVTDMVVHAGFMSQNPFSEDYTKMLACVRLLGGELLKNDMNLLFETGGESPITMLRLIQDYGLGNLYVNLDTANLIMYGFGNPVDALYTYGKYVRNVHAKDGMPPVDPRKCGQEVPVGQGYVDFERFIRDLLKYDYDRFIIVERELGGAEQDKEIIRTLDYMKALVAKYKQ